MRGHAAIILTLVFWSLGQLLAIAHGQYAGQDYVRHISNIITSSHDPITLLIAPVTNGHVFPTLYHLIMGTLYPHLPRLWTWDIIACLNLCANLIGLIICYRLCLRVGLKKIICLTITTTIAFLPTFISSSIVIASDALLFPITMILLWYTVNNRHYGWLVLWLILIFLLRINYGFFAIAFIAIGTLNQRVAWIKAGILSLMIMSLMVFGFINHQLPTLTTNKKSETMRLDSLYGFQPHDRELWQAPYFHQEMLIDGNSIKPVQSDNRYSYWALLHAALFTDFLNIHQPIRLASIDPTIIDEYYTRIRPKSSQTLMQISLVTALPISLTFIIGLLLTLLCWKKLKDWQQLSLTMGLSVWLAMIAILPITNWVYIQGIWLPRHILVALICIGLSLAYQVSRQNTNQPFILIGCGYLFGQSLLHALFMFITPRVF